MSEETVETISIDKRLRLPPRGAGFWIRGVARVIDTLILLGLEYVTIVVVQYLIITVTLMARSPSNQTANQAVMRMVNELNDSGWISLVIGCLSMIAYHTLYEGLFWTSPGKALFGLIVLKQDGTPPDMKAALLRTLGFFVDGLFLGAVGAVSMLSSPMRQRRGDKFAGTVVIWQRDLRRSSLQREYSLVTVSLIVVVAHFVLMAIYKLLELVI